MTTHNNLSTVIFDSLNLLAGHYLDNSLSLINVIATANVPPQGQCFRVSRDQMRMRYSFVTNDTFLVTCI